MSFTQQPETASPRRFKRGSEAAAYIQDIYGQPCAEATLVTLRSRGGGPRFYKAGAAVLYAVEDLDAWALARMGEPVENTSQFRRALHVRKSRTRGTSPPDDKAEGAP
jgi:hypothetical protein